MAKKQPNTDPAVLKARARQLDQALNQARIDVRQAQRRVAKIQRKVAENQRQLHLALKRGPSASTSPTAQQQEAEKRRLRAEQRSEELARQERVEKQRLRSQTWWGKVRPESNDVRATLEMELREDAALRAAHLKAEMAARERQHPDSKPRSPRRRRAA